jgi:hypothetical protein
MVVLVWHGLMLGSVVVVGSDIFLAAAAAAGWIHCGI